MAGLSGSREGSALDELSFFHQSSQLERKSSSEASKNAANGRSGTNENVRHFPSPLPLFTAHLGRTNCSKSLYYTSRFLEGCLESICCSVKP